VSTDHKAEIDVLEARATELGVTFHREVVADLIAVYGPVVIASLRQVIEDCAAYPALGEKRNLTIRIGNDGKVRLVDERV